MSSWEVYDLLKRNKGKWLTSSAIKKKMNNIGNSSVVMNLKRIRELNTIEFKVVPSSHSNEMMYRFK